MDALAVRIMTEGPVCPSVINHHNAAKLVAWIQGDHHTPEGCNRTHCVHAPERMTVEWAATLTTEAMHICTCGEHGQDDPIQAAHAIASFRARWST